MKFNVLSVVMFGVGGILIYSGIKAYDPRDVLKWGLGGKPPKSFLPDKGIKADETTPGQRTPGGTWEDKQPDSGVDA